MNFEIFVHNSNCGIDARGKDDNSHSVEKGVI